MTLRNPAPSLIIMNYQQLIILTLQNLDLTDEEIANISINIPTRTITIIDTSFRKFAGSFPPAPLPFPDDEKPPKRTKMVKRTA